MGVSIYDIISWNLMGNVISLIKMVFYTFIIAINYKTRKNINGFAELTKNRS